jgi:hypothetical protein
VTPIRPAAYPVPPSANPAAEAARQAAQRAFFDQALGRAGESARTQAPTAPQKTVQAQAAPAAAVNAPSGAASGILAEPPARPLRPGSLLDIRV